MYRLSRWFWCDNCLEEINGTHLFCIDCTDGGWSNSMDLCSNCWSSTCSREYENLHHLPAHTLLQIRQPFPGLGLSGLFEQAKMMVQSSQIERSLAVDQGADLECKVCKKAIGEKAYWCCMACDGEYNVRYGFLDILTAVQLLTYVSLVIFGSRPRNHGSSNARLGRWAHMECCTP